MRGNNLIVLVVALVLGGVAAILARNWLVSHSQATAGGSGTIVVAAAPLAFGEQITAENTQEIPWSTATLPQGAFATKRGLLKDGRRLTLASIARNEPILREKITAPNQPATLSSMLAPGKRAVTVQVDDIRGVAGFIQPGDRVDVVLIRTEAQSRGNDSYSDVIVQSVKVLAVDQITGERTDKPTIAKAVTLEVDTENAEKILLASNIGRLSLILRQAAEGNAESVRRVTERDLTDIRVAPTPAPVVRAAASAPPPRPTTQHIIIWFGAKSQEFEAPID